MTHQLPESARRRLQMPVAEAHPDAGLLTAFAEQSLTAAERDRVLHHLAACASCREIVALAAPEPLPTEVPAAGARPWFRWPALHWVALAATAVIVWAAVLVLAPRTPNHDVSAPAESAAKIASRTSPALESKAQENPMPAAPPMAAAKKAAPVRESPGNELAKAKKETPRDTLDASKDLGMAAKQQAGMAADALQTERAIAPRPAPAAVAGALVANKVVPPPPTPPPPQTTEAHAENAPVSGAPVGLAGAATADSRNQLPTAVFAAKTGTIGGPVANDVGPYKGTAIIAGTITDPSGAVVPNALVRITNTKTNGSTAVRTDSAGSYRTPVSPGVYSVEVTSPGMQAARASGVAIAGPIAQNLTLRPGSMVETVNVTAASGAVAAASAAPAAQAEQQTDKPEMQAEVTRRAMAQPRSRLFYAVPSEWRTTPEGTLERSDDASSWTKVPAAPAAKFHAVFARGADVWAGGEHGALFHSTDGGRTWSRVPVGPVKAPITDTITGLSFSKATGSVSTSSGDIWLTPDGGATWARN